MSRTGSNSHQYRWPPRPSPDCLRPAIYCDYGCAASKEHACVYTPETDPTEMPVSRSYGYRWSHFNFHPTSKTNHLSSQTPPITSSDPLVILLLARPSSAVSSVFLLIHPLLQDERSHSTCCSTATSKRTNDDSCWRGSWHHRRHLRRHHTPGKGLQDRPHHSSPMALAPRPEFVTPPRISDDGALLMCLQKSHLGGLCVLHVSR